MTTDPAKRPMNSPHPTQYVYDFDAPPEGTAEERLRLLGGKGGNLVVMSSELGLPVPPGFIVTTSACLAYLGGSWPDGLDTELRAAMDRLGSRVGRGFGDAPDPLLVSVRSGAPVSMPGMMDTILNLGLNDATVAGLARVSGADFAADCLRRFRDGYASVIGSGDVPDDPWQQLRAAIEAVFRSWNSDRARAYRSREHIPDDLGTAVTVQAMVFGNRGKSSGTGVLFTRNPSTGENVLFGDVLFNAQGEDVVAGTHAPSPIAVLDSRMPEVAAELRRNAEVLERHLTDVADIEFTIDDGRLWMLQVRTGKKSPRAAVRMAIEMADDPAFPLTREEAVRRVLPLLADPPRLFARSAHAGAPIARGLPASPGVASGAVVTSSEAAVAAGGRGESVILVRDETSPEDVVGMSKAAGVLTARGGLTSHAAVVARGWGIPAVVGAGSAVLDLNVGERISIDGSSGEVFAGDLAGSWQVAPEAARLLAWARELGIEVVSETTVPAEARSPAPSGQMPDVSRDDVLRALAVKGAVLSEQLAEAVQGDAVPVGSLVGQLVADRLAENAAGQIRLTAQGKLAAAELFTAARSVVGDERAAGLLDEFHVLDGRTKALVTAWQVRDKAGEQVLNDHSDAAYDTQIMSDLATLHADTAAWLAPLAASQRPYSVYLARLSRALDLARAGDQRYVASPRVDSYHSVWFELHEDLIRLSGKKRAEATSG
ncbi:MAG TPA: pyruvate, phosphate dikinase, partial [Candidatus Limnocylindrales bacterium]